MLTGAGILSFYGVIAGWTVAYIWFTLTGQVAGDQQAIGAFFADFTANASASIVLTLLVLWVTAAVLLGGVRAGIERVTKALMPALVGLLLLLAARAVTLPGAAGGADLLSQTRSVASPGSIALPRSPGPSVLLVKPRNGSDDHLRQLSGQTRRDRRCRGVGRPPRYVRRPPGWLHHLPLWILNPRIRPQQQRTRADLYRAPETILDTARRPGVRGRVLSPSHHGGADVDDLTARGPRLTLCRCARLAAPAGGARRHAGRVCALDPIGALPPVRFRSSRGYRG